MSDRIGSSAAGVPPLVPFFNVVARPLLAAGVPMGFNGLVTIRGRKSGLPRTTPLAIIEVTGRRWIWSPWGEVQWVRNLRAAGRATITVRRRKQEVFDDLRRRYADLKTQWGGYSGYDDWFAHDLNNAKLNTVANYYDYVPAFQQLLQSNGGDLEKFYAAAERLAREPKDKRRENLRAGRKS